MFIAYLGISMLLVLATLLGAKAVAWFVYYTPNEYIGLMLAVLAITTILTVFTSYDKE